MTSGPRIVLIRPQQEFGSFENVRNALFDENGSTFVPRYFEAPLIAIVVDRNGMPVWAPTLYLADCAIRGRSVTGDTVRSYGEALQTWMAFLDRSQLLLDQVSEDDFAVFRNQLVHLPRQKDSGRLSSATANHRISVVCSFYLWGERCGLMSTKLGEYLDERRRKRRGYDRLQGHFRDNPSRSLAPAVVQRLPRLLSEDEVHLLFREARGMYRLAFKWALVTGLRRFEVCNLTVSQLPSPEKLALSGDGLYAISLLRKGSRDVTVHVPVRLLEETRWYVITERNVPRSEDEKRIFIGVGGNPITRNALSREFRRCADKIGSDATLHHLRHTFAINVLNILERRAKGGAPLNSIKTVQVLMGHASLESTEVYLRALDVSNESVMQALDYLYGATL